MAGKAKLRKLRKNERSFIAKLLLRSFILFLIVLLLIIFFFLFNVHRLFWSTEEREFYRRAELIINQGEKEFYIKDVTNFDWTTVCFLGSYSIGFPDDASARKIISKKVNINVPKNTDIPVLDDDGKWALVFAMNGKFILFIEGKLWTELPSFNRRRMKSYSCFGRHAKLHPRFDTYKGHQDEQNGFYIDD